MTTTYTFCPQCRSDLLSIAENRQLYQVPTLVCDTCRFSFQGILRAFYLEGIHTSKYGWAWNIVHDITTISVVNFHATYDIILNESEVFIKSYVAGIANMLNLWYTVGVSYETALSSLDELGIVETHKKQRLQYAWNFENLREAWKYQ